MTSHKTDRLKYSCLRFDQNSARATKQIKVKNADPSFYSAVHFKFLPLFPPVNLLRQSLFDLAPRVLLFFWGRGGQVYYMLYELHVQMAITTQKKHYSNESSRRLHEFQTSLFSSSFACSIEHHFRKSDYNGKLKKRMPQYPHSSINQKQTSFRFRSQFAFRQSPKKPSPQSTASYSLLRILLIVYVIKFYKQRI